MHDCIYAARVAHMPHVCCTMVWCVHMGAVDVQDSDKKDTFADNLHNQSLGSPLATASDDDSDMTSSGESNESSPSREHRGLMSTLASLFANKSRLRRAFSAFRHAARIFKAARVEIARRQRQVLGNYFRRGFVAAVRRARSVRRARTCQIRCRRDLGVISA